MISGLQSLRAGGRGADRICDRHRRVADGGRRGVAAWHRRVGSRREFWERRSPLKWRSAVANDADTPVTDWLIFQNEPVLPGCTVTGCAGFVGEPCRGATFEKRPKLPQVAQKSGLNIIRFANENPLTGVRDAIYPRNRWRVVPHRSQRKAEPSHVCEWQGSHPIRSAR